MKFGAYIALIGASAAVKLQWPSVARCTSGISTDGTPCDHDNRMTHNHDDTVKYQVGTGSTQNDFNVQLDQQWPSVARCTSGISTDGTPCDHDNRMTHNHDNTVQNQDGTGSTQEDFKLQLSAEQASDIVSSWPSVARCTSGISTDGTPCDHDNRMTHNHDNTVGYQAGTGSTQNDFNLQLDEQVAYRPAIKCMDPVHGNPISCDNDDIDDNSALAKDENGFTPVKVVKGGPSYNPSA